MQSVPIGQYCTGCRRFWPQKAPYWVQDERGEVVWSRIPEKDWPPNPHPDRGWQMDVDEAGVIVAVHAPPPPRPRPPLVAKEVSAPGGTG